MTNHLLQCFDAVGLVIRPVKTVGCITYIVLISQSLYALANIIIIQYSKKKLIIYNVYVQAQIVTVESALY